MEGINCACEKFVGTEGKRKLFLVANFFINFECKKLGQGELLLNVAQYFIFFFSTKQIFLTASDRETRPRGQENIGSRNIVFLFRTSELFVIKPKT